MKVLGQAAWIITAASLTIIVLLLVWGAWLLVTPDPDGGRHPVGAVMVVVALACASVPIAVVAVRRRRARP